MTAGALHALHEMHGSAGVSLQIDVDDEPSSVPVMSPMRCSVGRFRMSPALPVVSCENTSMTACSVQRYFTMGHVCDEC